MQTIPQVQSVEGLFFESVIEQMKRNGFELFSLVTVDDQDSAYHVPATSCRNTGMFFWVPGKAIIVQLAFNEWGNNTANILGVDRRYWTLLVYHQQKPGTKVFEGVTSRNEEPLLDPTVLPSITDPQGFILNWCQVDNGNEPVISQKYERVENEALTDPIELAIIIRKFVDQIQSTASSLPFKVLQVTGFPPTYTFPNCEATFWERFDMRNLRALVKKPWGSRHLER